MVSNNTAYSSLFFNFRVSNDILNVTIDDCAISNNIVVNGSIIVMEVKSQRVLDS